MVTTRSQDRSLDENELPVRPRVGAGLSSPIEKRPTVSVVIPLTSPKLQHAIFTDATNIGRTTDALPFPNNNAGFPELVSANGIEQDEAPRPNKSEPNSQLQNDAFEDSNARTASTQRIDFLITPSTPSVETLSATAPNVGSHASAGLRARRALRSKNRSTSTPQVDSQVEPLHTHKRFASDEPDDFTAPEDVTLISAATRESGEFSVHLRDEENDLSNDEAPESISIRTITQDFSIPQLRSSRSRKRTKTTNKAVLQLADVAAGAAPALIELDDAHQAPALTQLETSSSRDTQNSSKVVKDQPQAKPILASPTPKIPSPRTFLYQANEQTSLLPNDDPSIITLFRARRDPDLAIRTQWHPQSYHRLNPPPFPSLPTRLPPGKAPNTISRYRTQLLNQCKRTTFWGRRKAKFANVR